MNVNELLARVVSISHNEEGPETGLRDKALGWLNSAYAEMMDEILPFVLDDVAVRTVVSYDSDGMVILPNNCRRVVALFHQACPLEKLNRLEFEAGEEGYFVTGGRVHITPGERHASSEVRLVYVPHFTELEADGEIEILPAGQQHALIWGALVWGSTYERAFSAQGDLRLFQAKWEAAKREVKLYYAGTETYRVAAAD